MVDKANLGQASRLSRDFTQIDQALRNFDQGGVIVSMTISAGDMPLEVMQTMPQVPGVPVSTVGISYPPQMVDAIKTSLRSRQEEIGKQLEGIGVTGVGPEPEPAVPPAAPASPPGARIDPRTGHPHQPPHRR